MEQVDECLRRFRCSPAVCDKAREYLRLVEVRGSGGVTPTCQAAVCVELAAHQCKESINRKDMQRSSGVSIKHYMNVYQRYEKLLNIDIKTTIKDLSIRLGMPEMEELADQILLKYQDHLKMKLNPIQYHAIDFTSSLYISAALYSACRLNKRRCDRAELLMMSSVTTSTFNKVVEGMMKYGESVSKKTRKRHIEEEEGNDEIVDDMTESDREDEFDVISFIQRESFNSQCLSNPQRQKYIEWKTQILN